jgi:hypothetical protein
MAGVEYLVIVGYSLVLIGYLTALIPVRVIDYKIVLWHLEIASHKF